MPPAHVTGPPPTGGSQGVETTVVAHPGEGVAVDRGIGQFGQGGPGLKATRIAGCHSRDGDATLTGGQVNGGGEGGGYFGAERTEHGLGARARELDRMISGHGSMLG